MPLISFACEQRVMDSCGPLIRALRPRVHKIMGFVEWAFDFGLRVAGPLYVLLALGLIFTVVYVYLTVLWPYVCGW